LARHLNIPVNAYEAIDIINTFKYEKIDTATINGHFFLSIAGVGFDAHIANKFAKSRRRGFMTYFKLALLEYPKYKPKKYIIFINNESFIRRALLISFANSNQFGYNTAIAPQALINDGLLDICILKKVPVYKAPFLLHMLFKKKLDQSKYLEVFKANEAVVKWKKNNKINIDGDFMKLEPELHVKIIPLSLKVIVPYY